MEYTIVVNIINIRKPKTYSYSKLTYHLTRDFVHVFKNKKKYIDSFQVRENLNYLRSLYCTLPDLTSKKEGVSDLPPIV